MRTFEKVEVPTLADERPYPWVRGRELVIVDGRLVGAADAAAGSS